MKTSLSGKKIAIPGGTGFFGSHIADKLRTRQIDIDIPQRPKYDFRKKEDCLCYFKKVRPQIVINCAAFQGGIGFHSGKQADLFMDNILMGCHLMNAAQRNSVEKFVNI